MAVNQAQLNKSRLDKFFMVLNLPEPLRKISKKYIGSRGNNIINENSLQFSVYGAVVPSVTVTELTLGYGGQNMKVSTNNREPYPNVTVNFTIDNKFNNYWVLYKWLDLLNNDKESVFDADNLSNTPNIPTVMQDSSRSSTPPTLYLADFTIYAKDEFDKNITKFVYTNAFPVNLGGINYNYRTPGEIETTFEFAFSQLLVELV